MAFTCGLIRGALANLGIMCVVTGQTEKLPVCKITNISMFVLVKCITLIDKCNIRFIGLFQIQAQHIV